jgi:hypothetical protein
MSLGSTQALTEMSTSNFPGGKTWSARKAGHLTSVCEPIVWKIWEPRRYTTLWASTACYSDSLAFLYISTTQRDQQHAIRTLGVTSHYKTL